MVEGQEPVLPGCFLRARAIGIMPMIDQVLLSKPIKPFPLLLPHFPLRNNKCVFDTGRER